MIFCLGHSLFRVQRHDIGIEIVTVGRPNNTAGDEQPKGLELVAVFVPGGGTVVEGSPSIGGFGKIPNWEGNADQSIDADAQQRGAEQGAADQSDQLDGIARAEGDEVGAGEEQEELEGDAPEGGDGCQGVEGDQKVATGAQGPG